MAHVFVANEARVSSLIMSPLWENLRTLLNLTHWPDSTSVMRLQSNLHRPRGRFKKTDVDAGTILAIALRRGEPGRDQAKVRGYPRNPSPDSRRR